MITQKIKTKDEESTLALTQTLINAVGQEAIDNGTVKIVTFDDDKTQIALIVSPTVPENVTMQLDISEMNIVPRLTEDAEEESGSTGDSCEDCVVPEAESEPEAASGVPAADTAPEVELIDAGDVGVTEPVEHIEAELVSEPQH